MTDIDYKEKGQRQAITYGNGVVTEYTYDPLTFRLSRLKTTRPSDITSVVPSQSRPKTIGTLTGGAC